MKKILCILIIFLTAATFVSACGSFGGESAACADTLTSFYGPSGGGGGGMSGGGRSSGGGPSSGGGRSSGGSSSGGSSSGSKSSGASGSSSGKASGPAAPSGKTSSGAVSGPKAGSKPSASDKAQAKAEAPKSVSSKGSYTSSVTNRTYIYHGGGYGSGYMGYRYYLTPGYVVDYYDPYNPYNYWYFAGSPFYGRPYRVAGDCDSEPKEETKQNINITIDNDGKVVSADESTTPGTAVIKDATTGTTEAP